MRKMDKDLITEYDALRNQQDESIQGNNYFIAESRSPFNLDKILERLLQKNPGLKRVNTVEDCDFILVFGPIASRAGTDIQAALETLNTHSQTKPAIFVVLHHTFDPDKIVPDSSRFVQREHTLTVDCLFHEDTGLLECQKNQEALDKITKRIKNQEQSKCITTVCSVIWLGIQWCWTSIRRCCNNEVGVQNIDAKQQRQTYEAITNKKYVK